MIAWLDALSDVVVKIVDMAMRIAVAEGRS